ncbi:MAG: NAD(P)/FAD-dependent oxidoreductase, partial [Coxiellaceae bacterium]|nr:NAD(P)/FAD-dependent oxidoreductase [Coxiellaceae bacterium]
MEFDILIVGAGPAGLSAAIRLAQLNQEKQNNLSICVIDKAASIGAHILSGAVLEPRALNELIPNWQEKNALLNTPVNKDYFYHLSKTGQTRLPKIKSLKNHGNYIISLGQFCQWLAQEAESLGVNIFPGFPAEKILYENDRVIGVQTKDQGMDKNGQHTDRFQPGIHLLAKQTLFAEGCRGSLSELLIEHYQLRANADPQTYGIGLKELWEIPEEQHQTGSVLHTVGWPLHNDTYGGSFVYQFDNNKVAIGFVVGLDYKNPYLDPFKTFQQFKTHPIIRKILEGGTCIGYGARALNEGGFQSIPKLTFPGGLLIGCSAGFLNVGKIKGIHNAMKSGMLAAETIFKSLDALNSELSGFENTIKTSWIYRDLKAVRNIRPAFHKGLWKGLAYTAFDQYIFRGKAPWTLHNKQKDNETLIPARKALRINYPKPDGKL